MVVWKEANGYSCGINDDGDLFLAGDGSGYNLPDTPDNRAYILKDFDYYTKDIWEEYAY